ncbi:MULTISPECIES: serine protease [unclassified Streptomyces]|uniref:S1 family peptidase n=1 Tax=unclassified Streptomyces TaxID=2593676 RepID=UPI002DD8A04F|nr:MULTISPECIES: serine protease [unclassified Streptomyces]WSA93356.1 serine protease [Streptomyces sp. NBC_01795]WSS14028.1 serine protease [Streptomyces sp. NBC_01186]WSS42847.1 serine protease [Streptomyces sp. NBC_01187]
MIKRGKAALCAVAGVIAVALTMAVTPSASAIIGGHKATSEYPFMASVQKDGKHYCGASLIKRDWVVTAGHCTVNVKPKQLSVRVGDHDRTKGAEAKVTKVIAHPDFSYEPFRNDVAVMKLDHPVDAKPIKLATESAPAGTGTRILGWGMTCEDGSECPKPPIQLQELDTNIVPDGRCSENYNADDELCTDSPTKNAQACILDSGGPQIKGRPGKWELIGATSRDGDADPKCATGPGIYTDLTAHRDWIERATAK